MIPYYLIDHLIEVKEEENTTTGVLVSSARNTNLEIYFYGDLIPINGRDYICDGEFPCLIVAKDPVSQEEFVVFDGSKHGYDAMFCNEPVKDMDRELKLYNFQKGKISLLFCYAIDYESERENYTFNERNEIELIDGTYLDFEKAKSIGYDWLSMKFIETDHEFVDLELA